MIANSVLEADAKHVKIVRVVEQKKTHRQSLRNPALGAPLHSAVRAILATRSDAQHAPS